MKIACKITNLDTSSQPIRLVLKDLIYQLNLI